MKRLLVVIFIAAFSFSGPGCDLNKLDPRNSAEFRALSSTRRLEVRQNFQSFFVAQKVFFSNNAVYGSLFEDLSANTSVRYYAYFLPGNSLQPDDVAYAIPGGLQIYPSADQDGFLIVAVGNIDHDQTLDVWTLDQDNRIVNLVDDLAD